MSFSLQAATSAIMSHPITRTCPGKNEYWLERWLVYSLLQKTTWISRAIQVLFWWELPRGEFIWTSACRNYDWQKKNVYIRGCGVYWTSFTALLIYGGVRSIHTEKCKSLIYCINILGYTSIAVSDMLIWFYFSNFPHLSFTPLRGQPSGDILYQTFFLYV